MEDRGSISDSDVQEMVQEKELEIKKGKTRVRDRVMMTELEQEIALSGYRLILSIIKDNSFKEPESLQLVRIRGLAEETLEVLGDNDDDGGW